MYKKVLWIVVCLLTIAVLKSETGLNKYRLKGFTEFKNNKFVSNQPTSGFSSFYNDYFFKNDYKTTEELDTDSLTVNYSLYYGDIPLGLSTSSSFDKHLDATFRVQYHRLFQAKVNEIMNNKNRDVGRGLLTIEFDPKKYDLPKLVKKILGKRKSRLSLNGSQKITFSYIYRVNDSGLEDRETNTDFKMIQDLNLKLQGSIGEKINVSMTHHSNNDMTIDDPNHIEISYTGDEDEIIQSIEGGNISLSLTGSKYISTSASSEGLFGIKTKLKTGNLTSTIIFANEEGEKNSRTYSNQGSIKSIEFRSNQYEKLKYYYVVDPKILFVFRNDSELPGYPNNAIVVEDSKWKINDSGLLPRKDNFKIYYDDGNGNNNETTVAGIESGNSDNSFNFDLLLEGSDYEINFETGVISFIKTINDSGTIGIVYQEINGRQYGNSDTNPVQVKIIKRSNQDETTDTFDHELKSVYDIKAKDIAEEGLEIIAYSKATADTVYGYAFPGSTSSKTYNEYLGLNTGVYTDGMSVFVDTNRGLIWFPFLKPFIALADSIIYSNDNPTDLIEHIKVTGKITLNTIKLDVMNILKGSVKVRQDGQTLKEDIDYSVDYTFGNITIINPDVRNSDKKIEIDYEYKPLFSVDSKTTIGMRNDYEFTDEIKFGSSFIYHSEKTVDKHPKVGNENVSLIMADIDGSIKYNPPFMTKLVDWLPLIQTDEESTFDLSGEFAMTLPSLYGHKDQLDDKELYLDDMESVLDIASLPIGYKAWNHASRPLRSGNENFPPISTILTDFYWYNPGNLDMEDVYDPQNLTDNDKKENVTVLKFIMEPLDVNDITPDQSVGSSWGGIMKYVGENLDWSEKKYIELYYTVPDNTDLTMYIDMGTISEDFYGDQEFGSNGILNTEDIKDGIANGNLDGGEDTGYDNTDGDDDDLVEGDAGDDDWKKADDNGIDVDHRFVNNPEDNSVLDTEDMNGNGYLDQLNYYFEYRIRLDDPDYVVSNYSSETGNWKFLKIPIEDLIEPEVAEISASAIPTMEKIRYVRVWFENNKPYEKAEVRIASLDIVGNKWEEMEIKDTEDNTLDDVSDTFTLNVLDNKQKTNNGLYVSPKGTYTKEDGTETLEQSLYIEYNNIQPGHIALVQQKFPEKMDLTSYEKIRFWVYQEDKERQRNEHPQYAVMRIGSDSLTFYEIRYKLDEALAGTEGTPMIRSHWQSVEFDFKDLTYLKEEGSGGDSLTYYKNDRYSFRKVMKGNTEPTLSYVKEIELGLLQSDSLSTPYNGFLYFNDIRVVNPYEEVGFAARATLNLSFADFSTFTAETEWKTDNFKTQYKRGTNQSANTQESISLTLRNRYNLHKFSPAEWGLNLPLNMSKITIRGIPRFKANSDIVRDNLSTKEEKDRERTLSDTYSIDGTIEQSKRSENPFVAYTLSNTKLKGSYVYKENLTATNADTTVTKSVSWDYKLEIDKKKLGLNIFKNYQFFYLPNIFSNNFSYKNEQPQKWKWDTTTDESEWTFLTTSKDKRTFSTETSVTYDIFSDFSSSYYLETERDLIKEKYWKKLNVGQEIKRNQKVSLKYSPKLLDFLIKQDYSLSVVYAEDIMNTTTTTTTTNLNKLKGSNNRTFSADFTLKNSTLLKSLRDKFGLKDVKQDKEAFKEIDDYRNDMEKEKEDERKENDGIEQDDNRGNGDKSSSDRLFGISENNRDQIDVQENVSRKDPEEEIKVEEKEEVEEKDTEEEKTETDTLKKKEMSPFLIMFDYLSRLDDIDISFGNTYKTSFSDLLERPDFMYQLGFPHQLETTNYKEVSYTVSLSTGLALLSNIRLDSEPKYEFTVKTGSTGSNSRDIKTTFPDLKLSIASLEKTFRAAAFLSNASITSNYSYSEASNEQLNEGKWERRSFSKNHRLSPLCSWRSKWFEKLGTSLSVSLEKSYNESSQTNETESTKQGLSFETDYSFTAEKGWKVPFLNKRIQFNNQMTLELAISYNDDLTVATNNVTNIKTNTTNKSTLKIEPGISYNFHKNITGSLNSSYEKTNDKRDDRKISNFTLNISVNITF